MRLSQDQTLAGIHSTEVTVAQPCIGDSMPWSASCTSRTWLTVGLCSCLISCLKNWPWSVSINMNIALILTKYKDLLISPTSHTPWNSLYIVQQPFKCLKPWYLTHEFSHSHGCRPLICHPQRAPGSSSTCRLRRHPQPRLRAAKGSSHQCLVTVVLHH